MISGGIEKIFKMMWALMKLNFIFVAFSFLGGVIFGVGPAFQTISDLISEHQFNYQEITWKHAFSRWKANFKRGNIIFLSTAMMFALLSYSLYLSVQFQGLIWFIIDFILIFVCLLVIILYLYSLVFESSYKISLVDLFKLSFVSIFLNFGVFLKLLFGLGGIILLTWKMKGLLLFVTFSLVMFWVHFATRKNREIIDGKLASES